MEAALMRFVSFLLVLLLSGTSVAQQGAPLSKRQEVIKQKAHSLPVDARISVVPLHGHEVFGNYVRSDDNGMTVYDIDQKSDAVIAFSEVRKLKNGYGGYNSVQGKHTDHTKALVITLVVAGVLIGVIAAAAASK